MPRFVGVACGGGFIGGIAQDESEAPRVFLQPFAGLGAFEILKLRHRRGEEIDREAGLMLTVAGARGIRIDLLHGFLVGKACRHIFTEVLFIEVLLVIIAAICAGDEQIGDAVGLHLTEHGLERHSRRGAKLQLALGRNGDGHEIAREIIGRQGIILVGEQEI